MTETGQGPTDAGQPVSTPTGKVSAVDAARETLKGTVAEEDIVDAATDEVMRLHLEYFEGPFEVLLYLIKAQEIDVFDIPIVRITEQYLAFIELLEEENLEVTGDFLVMAATLIQIKSKMILPAEEDPDEEEVAEEDPRLELVEKLIEYRKYRDVAERLTRLEAERQNWYARNVKPKLEAAPDEEDILEVSLDDLIQAFRKVLRFFNTDIVHEVQDEGATIEEKLEFIDQLLTQQRSVSWTELFQRCRSRLELVCCFLAILELCRMDRLRIQQYKNFDEIRLFAVEHDDVLVPLVVPQDS